MSYVDVIEVCVVAEFCSESVLVLKLLTLKYSTVEWEQESLEEHLRFVRDCPSGGMASVAPLLR